MKIEQAIYGEVRGGHALRLATEGCDVATALASRLDLPDTAPPGVDWSPFVSGFPFQDRYVLARTFADPTATRAGMVISHALIAPLAEAAATADLRPLIRLLVARPEVPNTLEITEATEKVATPPQVIDLEQAAEALTMRGSGPVVRVALAGFEDLVTALWFHLWPELRARFAFRLSFGPSDLVDTPTPALVCTPAALAARWTGHRIIGAEADLPVSPAAAILTGRVEAEPVLRFAREIGAGLDQLADLPLLERAYETGTASSPSFETCITALRLVETLSPHPAVGMVGKVKLVDKLNVLLESASVEDILRLRNLSTVGLPTATALWISLAQWVAANAFAAADDSAMLAAIEDALSVPAAVEPWRHALLNGLVEASDSDSTVLPAAFWRWAAVRSATLKSIVDHLPSTGTLEARLVKAAPQAVDVGAGEAIMAIAKPKAWWHLHGAAAGASLPPNDAVRRQLSVDKDPASLDGLRAAVKNARPDQLLAFALEAAEPRMMKIAAEAVVGEPRLLKDLDFETAPAQEIWAAALSLDTGMWRAPANPQAAFVAVIHNLLDGGAKDTELISALSMTPLADLSEYPRRSEVWSRVAPPDRARLLAATASGWLKVALIGAEAWVPDDQLEVAILTNEGLEAGIMGLAARDPRAAVRLMDTLQSFDEARFLPWLEQWARRRPLAAPDAEAVGRLVLDRQWRRALARLLELARAGREDVKPALRVCHDMIALFTRWLLDLSPISTDDKWGLFQDLAIELYPGGPDQDELWDRAGGRNADLLSGGSGGSRWRDAIGQIRRGKRPHSGQLLDEMRRDYSSNDQVRYLANDADLGTSR